jgi:cell division protein FtsZ
VLINIRGSSSLTLSEVSEAATLVQEAAHEDANIIFGQVIDDTMKDAIQVTVIATAFGGTQDDQQYAPQHAGVVRMQPRTEPRQQQKKIDRDIPAFVRKERHELQATRVTRVAAGSDLGFDDEYDTPTFLRKQAD